MKPIRNLSHDLFPIILGLLTASIIGYIGLAIFEMEKNFYTLTISLLMGGSGIHIGVQVYWKTIRM